MHPGANLMELKEVTLPLVSLLVAA